MKKNLIMLLCMLIVIACALASCGHKHEFSDEWYGDETSHWHPAECEHGEVKDSLAPHVDADEDGICDICKRADKHEHTYENQWTYDEFNHWKNATCTHANEKGSFSLHVDEANDSICDMCGSHVHKINGAGYCLHADCGKKVKEVDETSLDELIEAIYAQKHLANGGNIDYKFTGNSNTSDAYKSTKTELVDYVFGKDNFTYTKVDTNTTVGGTNTSGSMQTWHQLVAKDITFGVTSTNGGALEIDANNPDRLNGYYIALSTFVGDYGVENTLYQLYLAALGQDLDEEDNITGSLVGSLETDIDSDGNKVTFKYYYKTLIVNSSNATDPMTGKTEEVHNVNLFAVEVSFSYNDDYALTELTISCDCFTNDPGTSADDGFLENDVDLDYDPNTGVCTLRENALADNYTIVVNQTAGERTRENENPQSKFIPDDFDLYRNWDKTNKTEPYSDKVTTTINASVRDYMYFYVGECYPEGTSLDLVHSLVSFELYRNGSFVTDNGEDYDNKVAYATFTLDGKQRSFAVMPKTEGAYQLIIYINGQVRKVVDIIVGVVNEEDIKPEENQKAVKVTEAYAWVGQFSFTATKAGTYFFVLPEGVGFVNADEYDRIDAHNKNVSAAESSLPYPDPYFDFQNPENEVEGVVYENGAVGITFEAGQTIRFYVNAAKAGTYLITYSEP